MLSMGDVMRAICFSPVKGACVWESVCESVCRSVILDVPFDQTGR